MRIFLIWNISLALLLGFADQQVRLFGMIIIGLSTLPLYRALYHAAVQAIIRSRLAELQKEKAKRLEALHHNSATDLKHSDHPEDSRIVQSSYPTPHLSYQLAVLLILLLALVLTGRYLLRL